MNDFQQLVDQQTKDRRYEKLVFDGARDLAVAYRDDHRAMALAFRNMGASETDVRAVVNSMRSPAYDEEMYRGEMCDEGVIEDLKVILRKIHSFGD